MTCSAAAPSFRNLKLDGTFSEVAPCDFDGDNLQDLLLIDDFKLTICFQHGQQGFPPELQRSFELERRPSLISIANSPGSRVFVMVSDGVGELSFSNRTISFQQIIKAPTIVPAATDATNALRMNFCVKTLEGFPLLLIPTGAGLQVWRRSDTWRQTQLLQETVRNWVTPSVADPGYDTSFAVRFSVADINGDLREDLMIRQNQFGATNLYHLYLQQSDGSFGSEPNFTYADQIEPYCWLGWYDLNRDGKVDLVKGVWLDEPSFLPGLPSGKVIVRTYLADSTGRIPTEPQQVFRKNDWNSQVPLVDLNGDGFLDLVLGYSPVDSREGVRKQITAKQLDFSLKCHLYREGRGFAGEPDFQRELIIALDHADLVLSWRRGEYFDRYVNLEGDFNGDKHKDLLVRESGNEILVYFFGSTQQKLSTKPNLRFDCPERIREWQVTDLNGDRISDLVVNLQKAVRIFISSR